MDYTVPPRWKKPEEIPNTRHKRTSGHTYAKFRCFCGNVFIATVSGVNCETWNTCGCDTYKISKKFYDYKDNFESTLGLKLISVKFKTELNGERRQFGMFVCYCSRHFEARIGQIKSCHIRSCGKCLKKWENAPYCGEIDKKPSIEKIQKAIKNLRSKAKYKMKLTDDEIEQIIFGNCYWFGTKPSRLCFTKVIGDTPFYIHGIDRLDSSKPYTKENSVTCSSEANYFKGAILSEKFLKMCNQVVKTNERRIRNNKTYTTGSGVTFTNC